MFFQVELKLRVKQHKRNLDRAADRNFGSLGTAATGSYFLPPLGDPEPEPEDWTSLLID